MLEVINEKAEKHGIVWNPSRFIIDYEMGAINALQHVFPDAQIKGCLFHFAQSVWRHVQSLGMAMEYNSSSLVKSWVRQSMALALVPEESIDDGFLRVQDIAPTECVSELIITKFHDYIVDTWLDDDAAMFPR
jgi:hypothetical protein